MSNQFDRQVIDGIVVFSVRAPFSDDLFDDFLQELEKEVESWPTHEDIGRDSLIILDLTELPLAYGASSDGLGSLVRAHTLVSRRNGMLVLVGAPWHHSRRAVLDGFPVPVLPVFETYATVEDAIRKLCGPRPTP